MEDEVQAVAAEVREFLNDGLRAEEVMVICLDDRNARSYFDLLGRELVEDDIDVNNVLDMAYTDTTFIRDGAVTLTTVYRAKGNEAAAVFAMGVDAEFPRRRSRGGRNKLFTACTRAKAWLRVTGTGPGSEFFGREMRQAVANSPRLVFTYPDPAAVATLQRDLSDKFVELEKIATRLEQLDMLEEAQELLRSRGTKKE